MVPKLAKELRQAINAQTDHFDAHYSHEDQALIVSDDFNSSQFSIDFDAHGRFLMLDMEVLEVANGVEIESLKQLQSYVRLWRLIENVIEQHQKEGC